MLVTQVEYSLVWWQNWNVGDRFDMLVTDVYKTKGYRTKKSHQHHCQPSVYPIRKNTYLRRKFIFSKMSKNPYVIHNQLEVGFKWCSYPTARSIFIWGILRDNNLSFSYFQVNYQIRIIQKNPRKTHRVNFEDVRVLWTSNDSNKSMETLDKWGVNIYHLRHVFFRLLSHF